MRQTSWMTKYLEEWKVLGSVSFARCDNAYSLLLEDAISVTLEDTSDVADDFCHTTGHNAACKGSPDLASNSRIELGDSEGGEDHEERCVRADVRDVGVPAVLFDATCSQCA